MEDRRASLPSNARTLPPGAAAQEQTAVEIIRDKVIEGTVIRRKKSFWGKLKTSASTACSVLPWTRPQISLTLSDDRHDGIDAAAREKGVLAAARVVVMRHLGQELPKHHIIACRILGSRILVER